MIKYKKIMSSLVLAAFLWNLTGCNAENFFSSSQEQEETISVASEYGHELEPEIHQLVADSNYKVVDQNDGILFETALTEEEATSGAEVVLLDSSHQKKATLYDDGTHGDRIANDRIYTCNYKPEITNETEITCWATVGDIETEPVTIQYFDRLTENDFEEASKIGTMFSETVTEYTDAEGYIQEEYQNDALQKAGVLAETLYQEGKVIEYTVEPENQNVVFTLSSGITYVYQNKIAGTDSAALADKDISVITCQPCKSGYPSSISKYMSYPDEAAKYFADAFENINFTSNLDDSAVTRETLKSFSSNQIILWHGHGGL